MVIGVMTASLASCSTLSAVNPWGEAAPAATDHRTPPRAATTASDPLLTLVATMPLRTGQGFREPATGEMLKVEVIRAYDAASGRACREYSVTDQRGAHREGLACRNGDRWTNARPLRLDSTPR
jgi:hypothetical protein